jgi:hypothetical protein
MKRVRAMLLLSALGLVAHAARADEADWKPVESKPAPAPAPVPVPEPAPPAPTPPPVHVPAGADPASWRPAKRYPVEFPPPPAPTPAPVEAPAESPFRPVHAEPPVDEKIPAVLPPIQPIPKPVSADPPKADPPKPPSEQLPPPRPAPATQPPPPSGFVTTLKDDCQTPCPPLPPHPGVVPASGELPPMRHRVFGSPALNLSRDYAVRDLFGLDMEYPHRIRGGIGPDGAAEIAGPPQDLWFFQAEYLLWWVNNPRIPALATTSAGGTGFGFSGDPDTRNLLGPGTFGQSLRNGLRIRAGGYFDECDPIGVDGSFFFLGTAREKASFDSGQFPTITRPFFAPNAGVLNTPNGTVLLPGEFGEVVARPGLSTGRFDIETDSFLWGADVNFRRGICRTCLGGNGWFLGYRHVNLTERLRMTETLVASGPQAPDPVGTTVVVGDQFETRNRFHGGQVGYFWNRRYGRWDVDARASVAIGVTHQIIDIDGFQQRTRPGQATENFRGGLLAAGPNLGQFTDNRFSVVPEATLNLGYMVTPTVRVYAGYNFLYWNNVIRPGDQIDRTVDVTFVPNPPAGVPASGQNRPQPLFRQSDLWVNGIQFGAELRW